MWSDSNPFPGEVARAHAASELTVQQTRDGAAGGPLTGIDRAAQENRSDILLTNFLVGRL